jgi:hypothetical protein
MNRFSSTNDSAGALLGFSTRFQGKMFRGYMGFGIFETSSSTRDSSSSIASLSLAYKFSPRVGKGSGDITIPLVRRAMELCELLNPW